MDAPIVPIFLLSLPRSGSTLVQRILASHDGVATASEPWVLLPWLTPLRAKIPGSNTWQSAIHEAVIDFAGVLPGGRDEYRGTVHDAALRLYTRAAGADARFFVDKTPPYSMIIDEIVETFPEGRFIFLWRNPLGVVSSVVDTFAGGRWRPADYPTSLFSGVAALVEGFRRHGDRAFSVRYEDLLGPDVGAWQALCAYCGFEFNPDALARFADVQLDGRMGDPAAGRPLRISRASADKWRDAISSPIRKEWCRRYLRWIGRNRLLLMGYDLDALLAELDAVPARGGNVRADALDAASSLMRAAIKARVGNDGGTPAAWRAVLSA